MKHETRGRPSKLSVEIINKLKEAFAIGAGVEEACYYAEIDKGTYYNWIKDNEQLFNEFERLKQKPILKARQEVIKGLEGNPEFALKYLSKKKRDEFGDSFDVTSNGETISNVKVEILNKYEDIKDSSNECTSEDTPS